MTDKAKLTRRKLLAGIATAGVAGVGAGAGTYSYLSDEANTPISFITGSLDVVATPESIDFEEDDGDSMTGTVTLSNKGTLPAKQVHWAGLGITGNANVAKAMKILKITYRGQDVTTVIRDRLSGSGNGNGIFDLHDIHLFLKKHTLRLEDLVDGDGLQSDDETAELSVTVVVDYSQDSISRDNMKMTATVNVRGKQAPQPD
jgi:hypothetical protein